jgi:hypothetical protein
MHRDFDNDMYMLFNLAFEGLDKTDLNRAENDTDLEDIETYLRSHEEKPRVAIIKTRNREYPKALLYRKIVDGKAVMFAFWKRGSICEGMAASLEGVSEVNEFIWVLKENSKTYIPAFKPKADKAKKARRDMLKRVAVISTVVEPLNKKEYREIFGGDIMKTLDMERAGLLDKMKENGFAPKDAIDPVMRRGDFANISVKAEMEKEHEKHAELVVVQVGGALSLHTNITSDEHDSGKKLVQQLQKEAIQAERDEVDQARREQEEKLEHQRMLEAKKKNEELRKAGKLGDNKA